MAKTNDGLSGLLKQLSSTKVQGISLNKLLTPVNLIGQAENTSEPTAKVPSMGDTRTSSATKDRATGIQFGSPSNSRTSTAQSVNELSNLLKQTASGGIANALTGGLGSIAGLGGLVSGIIGLFDGGNKTLPPLIEFQLPQSQEQTVYVNSKGSTTFQGTDVEQASTSSPSGPIYTGTSQPGNVAIGAQTLQYQSSQIAQAVKNALLNSSSLNDVIAEI